MIPKKILERYLKTGHPLSFDDVGFVKGSGESEIPGALPIGTKFQGVECCAALNCYGAPCIEKPLATGRCARHTKVQMAFQNLTEEERERIEEIKIGELLQEIKVFKILLYRSLKNYNEEDQQTVKNTIALVEQVRALESEQYKLSGGTSNSNPVEFAKQARDFCKSTQIVVNIRGNDETRSA